MQTDWEATLVHEAEKRLGPPAAARRGQTARQILIDSREDHQIVALFGWLFQADFAGNPWRNHPALPEAVVTLGRDALAGDPSRRLWQPLCHAFGAVRSALGGDAVEFQKQLQAGVAKHLLPELQKRERLTRLSSASVGYGTNHLAVELSGLAAYIAVFRQDPDWENMSPGGAALTAYTAAYLQRFMAYMHPDGYWPESDGPADSYNTLSASALLRTATDLGLVEGYRAQFQAAAHYAALTILPDGRGVDITDGRNHFKGESSRGIRKCFGAFCPEGRAVRDRAMALLAVTSRQEPPIPGELLMEAVNNIRMRRWDGPEPAVSVWAAGEKSESLSSGFHFRQHGPWIAAASTFFSMPRPEGHWNLDYQNLWTLYHAEFGQVLFGSNGKYDMAAASFHKNFADADSTTLVVRDAEALKKYIPYGGRYAARADGFTLWREYRGFEATLDLTYLSDREARVAVRVDARTDAYPVTFTLLPALAYGQSFQDGAGKTHRVGDEPFTLTGAQLQGALVLTTGKTPVRIALPAQAELRWPYAMWNPYNLKTDRYEDIQEQTVLLDMPVGPEGAQVAFQVG